MMWNIGIPLQRPLFVAKPWSQSPIFGAPNTTGLPLSQVRGVSNTLLPHELFFGLCLNSLSIQGYGWCKAAGPKSFTAGFTGGTVCLSVWAAPSPRLPLAKAAASSQPRTIAGLSLNYFLSSSDWSPAMQITNVTWDTTLICKRGLSSPEHHINPPQNMGDTRKISFGKIYLPWD